jgi:hypothetical protein
MEPQTVYKTSPKIIEVRMSKCSLFFTEEEIVSLLTKNKELWIKAIGRGKAFLRNKTARKRESRNCDRWMLYELFKGNRPIDDSAISSLENMDVKELREGVLEWLLSRKRGGYL